MSNERIRIPADWDYKANGYVMGTPMADGRWWCLLPLTFGRFRIVIAEDIFTAGEHWCYDDNLAAILSYYRGPDVPPTGWKRHMRPDGTFERVFAPTVGEGGEDTEGVEVS